MNRAGLCFGDGQGAVKHPLLRRGGPDVNGMVTTKNETAASRKKTRDRFVKEV